MKDEAEKTPEGGASWFLDPSVLLLELKRSTRHWGQVPSIDGYDRMVEIRRGGQGVIYRARQRSTNRKVAVKVLLDGIFASAESRARFQREIELVAKLRHPHIVPIFDSGLTRDGRLYYVMEYVEGAPLDSAALTSAQELFPTLERFVKICDAVRHAHQHGIIHRDLKPGNILVDREGEPHVLDFGLAKLGSEPVEMDEGACAAVSRTGQFLGSLAWASPEQFEEAPDRIDLRTDVYSLGVNLYQLLTGRLPHPPSRNLRRTINAIVSEPPEPLRASCPFIPDDVETVVLRSLAKAPDRRYQSAGELMGDIRHFLAGEPIDAKRDRTLYVLRKTLGRHKAVVCLAGLVLLLIIGFATAMAVLYPRALHAEKQALNHLEEAVAQAARANGVRGFLTDMLSSSDPFVSQGRQVTLRHMLDAAALKIHRQFGDYPLAEAEIRAVMGEAYYHLGQLDEAEEQGRTALAILEAGQDPDPIMKAKLLVSLGILALDRRHFEEADARINEALDIFTLHLGVDHLHYADCLHSLAQVRQAEFRFDEAGELYGNAQAFYEKDGEPRAPRILANLCQWSGLLISTRRLDEAVEKLNQALEIIDQDPGAHEAFRSGVLFYLGLARFNRGELEEAEAALEGAMESLSALFGEEHLRGAEIATQLGHVRRDQQRYDEAEIWYGKALAIYLDLTGRESAGAASSLWNLAQALWYKGDGAAAEARFEEALAIRRKIFGPEHHYLAASVSRLGILFSEAGQWDKALPYLEESAELQDKSLGADHPYAARARALHGECLSRLGWYGESEPILLGALALLQDNPAAKPAYVEHVLHALVTLYNAWNKPTQAAVYQAKLKK